MSQRFKSLINSAPELHSLLNTVQKLSDLQQHFNMVAPPYFAQASQVLGLRQGTLSIATINGTLAAKLRQLAPELVIKLQNRGCEVSGIRVKVQVNYTPVVKTPVPRMLSSTAQHQLQAFSQRMADSPLKLALERFSHKTENR